MKYTYLTVSVEQDKNENIFTERTKEPEPGNYAYVIKVSENEKLYSVLNHIGGLKTANISPTKKRAQKIADYWNKCYKENGTYFY